MKSAILFSLLATAAAFAPAKQAAKTAVLSATASPFENEIGAQAPLGFWDPLGYVADGDREYFDRLRYVEVKHGRIAMMGVVGYLTTAAGIRFPGLISLDGTKFSDIESGWAGTTQVPVNGALQVLLFIAVMELWVMKSHPGVGNEFNTDFRNGALDFGWDKQSTEWKAKKRAVELNQGRAAQMGMLGLMVHDKLGNVGDLLPPGGH